MSIDTVVASRCQSRSDHTWPAESGHPAGFALIYPYAALILFALQMLPSFLRAKERDLGTVAKYFLKDEQDKLGNCREPIALLLPLEAQELILEIIRLRMLLEVTEEIGRLRRILTRRSWCQGMTTVVISLAVIAYGSLVFVGRVSFP